MRLCVWPSLYCDFIMFVFLCHFLCHYRRHFHCLSIPFWCATSNWHCGPLCCGSMWHWAVWPSPPGSPGTLWHLGKPSTGRSQACALQDNLVQSMSKPQMPMLCTRHHGARHAFYKAPCVSYAPATRHHGPPGYPCYPYYLACDAHPGCVGVPSFDWLYLPWTMYAAHFSVLLLNVASVEFHLLGKFLK